MFEVDGRYANRKGYYTVLSINPPKMTVRFDDGSIADLRIGIQERIWENLQAEMAKASGSGSSRRGSHPAGTRFYIKSIPAITEDDMDLPNIKDYLVVFAMEGGEVKAGDRFIYLAYEQGIVFAVATITGEAARIKGAAYNDLTDVDVFPVDIDTFVNRYNAAISVDSIELDSQPDFAKKLATPDAMLEITEDEFENVAEMLSEEFEEDDEDGVEIDDEDDDEPEIEV